VLLSSCTKLRDEQLIAAADAVSRLVSDAELASGRLLPPLSRIRSVASNVASVVAAKAYAGGYATALPKPRNMMEEVERQQYSSAYRRFR